MINKIPQIIKSNDLIRYDPVDPVYISRNLGHKSWNAVPENALL